MKTLTSHNLHMRNTKILVSRFQELSLRLQELQKKMENSSKL